MWDKSKKLLKLAKLIGIVLAPFFIIASLPVLLTRWIYFLAGNQFVMGEGVWFFTAIFGIIGIVVSGLLAAGIVDRSLKMPD